MNMLEKLGEVAGKQVTKELIKFFSKLYRNKKLPKKIEQAANEAASRQSQDLLALCMDKRFTTELFKVATAKNINVQKLINLGMTISLTRDYGFSRRKIMDELMQFALCIHDVFQKIEPKRGEFPNTFINFKDSVERYLTGWPELDIRLDIDTPGPLDKLQPSRWLRPYNTFIPMKGREPYMEKLRHFYSDPAMFKWMVITGDGGMGKTRLAFEFTKEIKSSDWNAGFLGHEDLEHLVGHDGFCTWEPVIETLIVIDYAASRVDAIKKLLVRCEKIERNLYSGDHPAKIRLLLLERHGNEEEGWLAELLKTGDGKLKDRVCDTLEPVCNLEMPGAENLKTTVLEILELTFVSWQEFRKLPAPELPVFDDDAFSNFMHATKGRPLYIQMAGIQACESMDTNGLFRWTQADLLKVAVKRERDHIQRIAKKVKPLLLVERAAALLTITGPQEPYASEWLDLLDAESKACGYPAAQPGEISEVLVKALGNATVMNRQMLAPILPDIIGAGFFAEVFGERSELMADAGKRLLENFEVIAWGHLLRVTVDLYATDGFPDLHGLIMLLLPDQSQETLYIIDQLMPQYSAALNLIRASVNEQLIKKIDRNPEKEIEIAVLYNNLGSLYSDLGRHEEALEPAKRAVEIYERLARKNPDAYENDLAMSLNNLGSLYSNLGRHEEALEPAKRAVEIRERLARKNPDAYENDLAMSLGAYGYIYYTSGNQKKASEIFEKGVSILRRLYLHNSQAHNKLMVNLLSDYLRICKELDTEPNAELLGPILSKMEELKKYRK
jgi:tetratricopeptide (TPR) repeat protein